MAASRALRRALFGWGLGHVLLGDRRGWLLLALEVGWLAALLAALPLLPTDRWLVIFGLLAGFIAIWTAQAVLAYRTAARRAGGGRGALQVGVVLAAISIAVTAYWTAGGATASPESTLQRYVSAWELGRPDRATALFVEPIAPPALTALWDDDTAVLTAQVAGLAGSHPDWHLDVLQPYRDLRFEPAAPGEGASPTTGPDPPSDAAAYAVEVVRLARLPTTFLGFIPSSRTETVVVAVVGSITIVKRPAGVTLPAFSDAAVWLIDRVDIDGPAPAPAPE